MTRLAKVTSQIWCESRRPWKLVTLAIGIALLVAGSFLTPAPDWDIPVSFIMAAFTYLFAGWSMHVVSPVSLGVAA